MIIILVHLTDDHNYWVDASDIGKRAGNFVWSDETPVELECSKKHRYRPDEFREGLKTCVYIYTLSGVLCDATCSGSNINVSMLCEVPDALDSCF
jgi:hypothetical protein